MIPFVVTAETVGLIIATEPLVKVVSETLHQAPVLVNSFASPSISVGSTPLVPVNSTVTTASLLVAL